MLVIPLEDAFGKCFPSDAHFVTYQVLDSEGNVNLDNTGNPAWPRCNTPILGRVRAVGGDLVAWGVVMDYDSPGKREWDNASKAEFIDRLMEAPSPFAQNWSCVYFTRHGARLVWVYTRPVPVDKSALMHRGLRAALEQAGIVCDRACSDWTRLFRLPKVLRDGTRSEGDPHFEIVEEWGRRLDPDVLVPLATAPGIVSAYGVVERIDRPRPDVNDALASLEEVNASTGIRTSTLWYREAKRRLKNRACYPVIFEHAPLAEEGSRDSTLHRLVGEAVSLLYYLRGSSPELIYALFVAAAQDLRPDAAVPDWTAVLWDKVCRIWAREKAKADVAAEREASYTADAMNLTSRVLEGMRSWCMAPDLHRDDATAIEWMSRRMIACIGDTMHVMDRDGEYHPTPVRRGTLAPMIRELGMEPLIPLEVPKEDGGYKQVDAQTIINRHGTIVAAVTGVAGGPHKGIIRSISMPSSTLVLRLFQRRTDIEPGYDSEVDKWLQLLAGDNYAILCDWIGHALDIEGGPICALSIAGPAGVGKKLLAQGLAECIDTETLADAKEFGHFQSALMRTPFVVINEGFPDLRGSSDPADTFRKLVGGDPITVELKFRPLITIHNPCRLVFTANNRSIVHTLAGKRELSPEDRAALAVRLLHIDADDGAALWFRAQGGAAATSRPGRRWIKGDSGQQSDYVVARHFLWLHGQRTPPRRGSRLLVEGMLDGDLMREMSTRTASAPAVVETLVRMLAVPAGAMGAPKGLVIEQGRIYVTAAAIVDAHRRDIGTKDRMVLRVDQVHSVLRGLMRTGSEAGRRTVGPQSGSQRARWYEVDPRTLLAEAEQHGYDAGPLEKIVAAAEALGATKAK